MGSLINGLEVFNPKIIENPNGNIFHVLKNNDNGFNGFGEVYLSEIKPGFIKGWKRHSIMQMNLLVVKGSVRFVFFDDRDESSTNGIFDEFTLSFSESYRRLSVPPGLWFAFQGLASETSLVLNTASILHNPKEQNSLPLDKIEFNWEQ